MLDLFTSEPGEQAAHETAPDALDSPDPKPLPDEFPLHDGGITVSPRAAATGLQTNQADQTWREELNQRVESYRRRRERPRGASDSRSNLEFDFEESQGVIPATGQLTRDSGNFGSGIDVEFVEPSQPAEAEMKNIDSLDLGPEPQARGERLEPMDLQSEAKPRHVEFVLDVEGTDEPEMPAPLRLHVAPVGRRLIGGVIDAVVLLLAAGVFGLIFSRAGGHASASTLNLAVFGFIAAVFLTAYFGAFTAITSTTPGLLWAGIEVRNLDGGHPSPRQALWRAFGYLVSISAVMLGFVWALVDNEGFTWHDRISDTYLTPTENSNGRSAGL